MTMRVLVTGGAGFIGSHVVDALIDAGREVIVLDSLSSPDGQNLPHHLNDQALYVWGDVRDPGVLAKALPGVSAVCHHAAAVGVEHSFADAVHYVSHNDLGSAELLRALHGSGWTGSLVLASSMVVYGEGAYSCRDHGAVRPRARHADRLAQGDFESRCPSCGRALTPVAVTEDAPLDPLSIYAATKVHQEHLFAAFGRAHDVPVSRLRYHNVYGPRMPRRTSYAGVAAIFKDALSRGSPPEVFEDGGQLRDFVHVSDVAAANLAALEAAPDDAINIASGEPRSVLEMAKAMADAIDPALAPRVTGRFHPGDVRHVFAAPSRAETLMDWRPKVGFAEAIKELAGEGAGAPAGR